MNKTGAIHNMTFEYPYTIFPRARRKKILLLFDAVSTTIIPGKISPKLMSMAELLLACDGSDTYDEGIRIMSFGLNTVLYGTVPYGYGTVPIVLQKTVVI
jgi:hypothetical protein